MIDQIRTEPDYDNRIRQAPIVVIDFYALWCGPCRMIQPLLEEYDNELATSSAGKVAFFKVDVDECADLAAKMGVAAMPTFVIYHNGTKATTVVGASMPKIKEQVDALLEKEN